MEKDIKMLVKIHNTKFRFSPFLLNHFKLVLKHVLLYFLLSFNKKLVDSLTKVIFKDESMQFIKKEQKSLIFLLKEIFIVTSLGNISRYKGNNPDTHIILPIKWVKFTHFLVNIRK